jgi:hypothetical protein
MANRPVSKTGLSLVLVLAGTFCLVLVATVLWYLDGWEYYRTPLATRGYMPAHKLLRPSGTIGLPLGVAGAIAMLSTLPYAARKHWRPLARLGSTSKWLEVHIFFGIVGPVLVTLHTAFKFKGLVAVGYWLMMTVWSSGFIGRYLYVRIPRSIRGVELTRNEIEAELQILSETVSHAEAPPPALVAEHARLQRRLANLERTRRLFEYWHVFHRPLVYAMVVIVGLHVAVAIYLGYAQLLTVGAP